MADQPRALTTLGAILFGLSISVVAYVGLAWLLHSQGYGPEAAPEWLVRLRSPLFGAGVVLVALPHLLETALLARRPAGRGPSPHQTVYVIGLALCETTAVLGLLLFLLGLPLQEFLYFAGVSLVGILAWGLPRLGSYARALNPPDS